MKNEIRKIVREEIGEQLEISEFSDIVTDKIINKIIINKSDINDGHKYEFTSITSATEKIRNNTKIDYVKIYIDYLYKEKFQATGNFSSGKTILLDNGFYEAAVKLEIQRNTDNINKEIIHSIISHELNHAFVYIKQLSQKSKTHQLNIINKITISELENFLKKYPEVNEFTKMFYLSLPQEINARVQQTATELKYITSDNYEDTIWELRKFNPINDARHMINYKLDSIKKLDKEILAEFVNKFNSNIKKLSNGTEIKTISNVDSFFEYWATFIQSGGNRLHKNILRLVAKKHQLDETYAAVMMDPFLAKGILGEAFQWD